MQFLNNRNKGNDMAKVSKKEEEAQELLKLAIQSTKIDAHLTEKIVDDLMTANKDGQTTLTKVIDKVLKGNDEEAKKDTKTFLRTKLQVMIKNKNVQKKILGDKKGLMITMKKVNNPMVDNDEGQFLNIAGEIAEFNESDIKSVRVVVEQKKPNEPKSFEEELYSLLEKHNKVIEDLIPVFKANGLKVELKA
tara:strand:+ start:465 stop:1040 length:576 start_codon:yes stop_codon:yes gene_type:complete